MVADLLDAVSKLHPAAQVVAVLGMVVVAAGLVVALIRWVDAYF